MGKTFNVDSYEKMKTVSKKLTEHSSQYTTIYTTLFEEAKAMEKGWSGVDNQVYVSKLLSCSAKLELMAKKMEIAATKLMQITNNYEKTQQNIVADVSNLPN